MSRTIELIAYYRNERFRFENTDSTHVIIAVQLAQSSKQTAREAGFEDVDGYLTFRGDLAEDFTKGMAYRFLGIPNTYQKTGERQLNFRTYVTHIAHDPESIANYLAAAGRGNGIGPSKAQRIVRAFGVDSTLEVCRTNPERVAIAAGITTEQAKQFAAILIDQQKTENATLELDKLLTGRGFPKSLPKKLIQTYGNRAAEMVVADPFLLMQFTGVGFKKADALYMQLRKDPRSLDRLALCLWYGMNSDNSGNVWFPAKYAVEKLSREIGGTDIDFRGAIIRGREFAAEDPNHYGAIASIRTDAQGYPVEDGPQLWLAEAKHDADEISIVDSLKTAREESESMTLTAYEQVEEVTESIATAARCARCYRPLTADTVHILAGKPYGPTCIEYMGSCDEVVSTTEWLQRNPVLKRTMIDNPIGFFGTPAFCIWPEPSDIENISDHQREQIERSMNGRIGILTGSPGVGKTYLVAQLIKTIIKSGAVGIEDIGLGAPTGKAAVRLTETLYKAGVAKRARTLHSHLFSVGEDGKLPFKVFIVDECSMKDLPMMAAVLRARAPGCHVLLVGDPYQLAPVGPGAPFRDLIAAGVPAGHLTKIERNGGEIVEACARIRDMKPWDDLINRPNGNLHWHESHSPERSLDDLEHALAGIPLWDAQVLVALNDKGPLCRQEVNKRLQQHYNQDGQPIANSRFRIGDKVVCLKNSWFESANKFGDEETNAKGELYVANGELGEVTDQHAKGFVVRLESPSRSVIVPMRKQAAEGDEESKEVGTGSNWDLGYAISVHKCVHPETLVETDCGLIPIRLVGESGVIGTPRGPQAFTNRVSYLDCKCLKITTNEGNSITVTHNHKCERWDGQQYVMCDATELKVGDFVRTALFPSIEPKANCILPQHHGSDSRAAQVKFPQVMNPELAEFLGLCVADGCVFRAGIRLGKRHKEVTDRFCGLANSQFGIEPNRDEYSGMFVAEIHSAMLRDWILNLGGCYPKHKHVPEGVMRSSVDVHAAFLRGLFEDGTVSVRNNKLSHVEWSTSFPRLLNETRAMLNRLGIICGQNSQRKSRGLLYIYGQEAKRFASRVGFISEFKRSRLELEVGECTRYRIPVSRAFIESAGLTKSVRANALNRGYISRRTANLLIESDVVDQFALSEMLSYHHSQITSIESTTGPTMCVTVPATGKFIQNGFPWGNSQGSEFPHNFILIDDYPGARQVCDASWVMTAKSRGRLHTHYVGRFATVERFCRVQRLDQRKTFLRERIIESLIEMELAGL